MILKIKTRNDNLGDIILKNPESNNGTYSLTNKNGVLFGHYVGKNEYHMIFQDHKYSYARDESNQLDYMSYCSPNVVLDMLSSSAFRHMLLDVNEYANYEVKHLEKRMAEIDNKPTQISFQCFIDSSWIDKNGDGIFKKYFKDKVEIQREVGFIYNVTVKGVSAFEAFNLCAVIAMFCAVVNPQHWHITDPLIEKYIRIFNNIDVPYFIIYLFKVRLLHEGNFEKHKEALESALWSNDLKLTYGNTHKQRMLFIKEHIDLSGDILDYGCGEGQYLKMLGKQMNKGQQYFAYDIENVGGKINHLAKYVEPKVYFSQVLSKLKDNMNKPLSVIISEVIEHNELDVAEILIKRVMREIDYKQIIITTVNRDFNQFYAMDKEMRHEDHVFEMSQNEFIEFMRPIIESQESVKYSYIQIGDCIDGIYPTQGYIIEKI